MKPLLVFLLSVGLGMAGFSQSHRTPHKEESPYPTGLFKSDNAYTLNVENDPVALASFDVFQYLQGRIPGLLIYDMGPFYAPYVSYRTGTPAFFLDEVRVDAKALSDIPMQDVAMVKVFRPPFFGSFGGANGAIAVYTKRGAEDDEQ